MTDARLYDDDAGCGDRLTAVSLGYCSIWTSTVPRAGSGDGGLGELHPFCWKDTKDPNDTMTISHSNRTGSKLGCKTCTNANTSCVDIGLSRSSTARVE